MKRMYQYMNVNNSLRSMNDRQRSPRAIQIQEELTKNVGLAKKLAESKSNAKTQKLYEIALFNH